MDIIPVILGATATGKTAIGIELAKSLNGEIISVDSRKVFKHIPIGTATPNGVWKNGLYLVEDIPHHLVAQFEPDERYNAGDFARDAEILIREILERGKQPILVGGTGFYFKALASGLPPLPPTNEPLRQKLSERLKKFGRKKLYQDLQLIDPDAAQKISSLDSHKLIRALEVFHLTGQPFSAWKNVPKKASTFKFIVLGLQMDKAELEQKIEQRSKRMFEEGMIEETKAVIEKGFSKNCPALLSFGFREAVEVLEGTMTRSEFLTRLIKGTKAYAKRQNTWFRTQIKPLWFESGKKQSTRQLSLKMSAFLKDLPTHLIYSPHD